MTLGEKLKSARLAAGLSQKQLCGDTITRNMLSQIENGSANPSMETLRYLAGRLGKSVGWFLQEEAVESPNPPVMRQARLAYSQRRYGETLEILRGYQTPDPLFDEEWRYLWALCALAMAQQLLSDGNAREAAALLEEIDREGLYYRQDMEQTRRQLLRRAYPLLEEEYRDAGDFEQAYYCATKLRQLPPCGK